MTCIGATLLITRPGCVRDHVKEVFLPTLSLQLIFFLLSDFDLDFTHAKRRKSPGNFSEKKIRMDNFISASKNCGKTNCQEGVNGVDGKVQIFQSRGQMLNLIIE